MGKKGDMVHRVFPLGDSAREAVRTGRAASSQTNQQFIAAAVTARLPVLVTRLQELGFGQADQARPVRLPFSTEAGTLAALRAASNTVGVPASQLLALCLLTTAADKEQPAPAKRRRGRPRKAAVAPDQPITVEDAPST